MATVKVLRTAVIEAIEETLNKLHEEYAMQESLEKEYQIAFEAWRNEILAFAIKNMDQAINIRTNYREWKDEVNIDFDIQGVKNNVSEEPTRQHTIIRSHEYKDTVADITKQLRILRMSNDEYVSASTLKSVGEYL